MVLDSAPPALRVAVPEAERSWWWRLHPVGRTRLVAGAVLSVTTPAAMATALAASGRGGLATQTLLMLSVVVATALVGGLLPAVVAAVLGGLLLSLVFVEPVGRLSIADPQQAVAVALFLVIGVAVALVVDLAARRAEHAARARAQADALTSLARRLLATDDDLAGLLAEAGRLFGRSGAAVWRTESDGTFTAEAGWGQAPTATDSSGIRTELDRDAVLTLTGPALSPPDRELLVAYAGHLRVVRDRARADRQAREAARLEQGLRTRTALLAAVSHDLRTPLSAIKAAAGSLLSTDVTWSERDRDELAATIDGGADRMGHLVDNLLDMTRLQTGAVAPLLVDVDLADAVDEAVRPLAGRGRVRARLPAELPSVRADAGLLERVVANLVENALQHAGGPVRVDAARRHDADGRAGVALDVVDRGPGVPADRRPQLFQPFRRLGDAPRGDGLGLGLAVARGLTEAMDGTLEADETPGGGLTMRVWLPAADT